MCRIFRAGDNYIAALNMPAQDDLCAALPIFSGQFGKQRLLLKRLIAMSQGVPCLDYDSLFIQEPFQFFFLRVRVRFCLQDGKLRFNPDSGRPAIALPLFPVPKSHLRLFIESFQLYSIQYAVLVNWNFIQKQTNKSKSTTRKFSSSMLCFFGKWP